MKRKKKTSSNSNKKLNEILKKVDILIVIQLVKYGLTRKDIADVLGISEKTIERMLPFARLKERIGERHE